MIKTIREIVSEHFMKNIVIYIIITICFTIGICTGAFTVNALDTEGQNELVSYMQDFLNIINNNGFNSIQIFKLSIIDNLKLIIIFWLLGITIIGAPIIAILMGIKGFSIGFTAGFMIKNFYINGIIFSLVTILPQSLIIMLGYIILSVLCINYSIRNLKVEFQRKSRNDIGRQKFINYTLMISLSSVIIFLGSIMEAYVTPNFIKSIAKLFIS